MSRYFAVWSLMGRLGPLAWTVTLAVSNAAVMIAMPKSARTPITCAQAWLCESRRSVGTATRRWRGGHGESQCRRCARDLQFFFKWESRWCVPAGDGRPNAIGRCRWGWRFGYLGFGDASGRFGYVRGRREAQRGQVPVTMLITAAIFALQRCRVGSSENARCRRQGRAWGRPRFTGRIASS